MRHKYIEERFPRYFIFGRNDDTGMCDISDGHDMTLATMSVEDAHKIIRQRDDAVDTIVNLAQELVSSNKEYVVRGLLYGKGKTLPEYLVDDSQWEIVAHE
jgi:hypothetical protein